jgi:wobble nucleotide-excising tRNase
MDNFFSNEPFEIPCPSCKKEINKPLGWFKKDIVICPFCKATIHTRKFRKELETAENNSLKFRKKL